MRAAFRGPGRAMVSLATIAIGLFLLVRLANWLVFDAVWSIAAPAECRVASGACWPFLAARFDIFVHGYYPPGSAWRVDLVFALVALALVLLLWRSGRYRRAGAALSIIVLPLAGGVLLFGGVLGLDPVPPSRFGGLMLTMLAALFAILTGLPLGIGLALMRNSGMPVLSGIATIWIEIWRGVPTVLALFLAITVFPLLVPVGLEIDKLLRALLVFTVLISALFAEAVRGGLQAVGAGQKDAGHALGLSWWQTTRLITLPQALSVSMPAIINACIALIKETTLVLLVGLYDLFGVVQAAITDPAWASGPVIATGYAAAAFGFWIICFGLSRLSRRFEVKAGN